MWMAIIFYESVAGGRTICGTAFSDDKDALRENVRANYVPEDKRVQTDKRWPGKMQAVMLDVERIPLWSNPNPPAKRAKRIVTKED